MGKVSLHRLRHHLIGIAIMVVLLFLCCTASAQSPQIQCKKSQNYSLGASIKAYDQLGWSAKDLDLGQLQALLPAGSGMLDPTLASSVGIRRVIAPELEEGLVVTGAQKERISASAAEVSRCAQAVLDLNQLTASLTSPNYLCSMIELDRSCMTSAEAQPHVPNPNLPKTAIVALLLDKTPFCSGILLSEGRLATVRHCFVDRGTGKLLPSISQATQGAIRFETADGSRSGAIPSSSLAPLALGHGYDINLDAVQLDVSVVKKGDALPLPTVRLSSLPDDQQALWVAGPVNDLLTALRATATPGPNGDWRDGFRWSKYIGAQCRSRARSTDCIYHTCQTFVGFSGSPLITRAFMDASGPVIEYAGLHSGTPGEHPEGFELCLSHSDIKRNDMGSLNVGNHAR